MKIVIIIIVLVAIWIIRLYLKAKIHREDVDYFLDSVDRYKVVKKYKDGFNWALYIYTKNGRELWNHTIPGSFMARDADRGDLTMVFDSYEMAKKYAENNFVNATETTDI